MRIVSVHFPKAAGSSLKAAWFQAFGKDRVLDLYTDNPADLRSGLKAEPDGLAPRGVELPPKIKVLHGHFRPHRYAHKDAILVTFLRHPVDNLLSIHSFWRTFPRCGDPLHEYFLDHGLTPIETARLPLLRFLMSRTYFGDFDMRRFSFIGDASSYPEDLAGLSKIVGKALPHLKQNVTTEREVETGVQSVYEDLRSDASLRRQLTHILAEDIAFYERVQRLRLKRRP